MIQICPDIIPEFFIKRKRDRDIRIIEGLPEDSKLIRAYYEPRYDRYCLIFESEEFDDIPEGGVTPLFNPVFESIEVKNDK